jgi:transposase
VTSIVDVSPGRTDQLLDVVEGRSAAAPTAWIKSRPLLSWERIAWGCLDLSGPYRKTFNDALPNTAQVADPFHVVKVRHEAPCLRGRVRDPPLRAVAAAR